MRLKFFVEAIWNADYKVWTSKSDIKGLVIETPTLAEFEEVMDDLAPELIIANHIKAGDIDRPLEQLIPIIAYNKPAELAFG